MSTEEKREQARDTILEYILENGLEDIGLRKLAKVSGISDRMLIYYYGTKEMLLADVFESLEQRVVNGLAASLGPEKRGAEQLISDLDSHLENPALRNVMMLLLEGMAKALRGVEPYRATIFKVRRDWHALVEERLENPEDLFRVVTTAEGRNLWRLMRLD